ncbi:MAG: hypothetical protein EOP83_02105 [Verrucomicrobiaceae bacterium]|nr:MAG: hypothetical protein EOP83_02105 [Verrucomicrobiaceae bacterium]
MAVKTIVWTDQPKVEIPPNWTIFRIGIDGGEYDPRLRAIRTWINQPEVPGFYGWRMSLNPTTDLPQFEHTIEVAMSDADAAFECKMRFG